MSQPATDWRNDRAERRRRELLRTLLMQFVQNGRSAQRILDTTDLSDEQTEAMEAIVAASERLGRAL